MNPNKEKEFKNRAERRAEQQKERRKHKKAVKNTKNHIKLLLKDEKKLGRKQVNTIYKKARLKQKRSKG